MDLEGSMLSEMSDREREILYDLTYMWNLKANQTNKTKWKETHRPTCWCWQVSCRGRGWLCLTVRTRTLATEVLGSIPWREPSQSPPLAPRKSLGRLQCWVASGQTTNREGTQPHPSADKWTSFTELCPPEQHPALPTTSPSHQEACTSLLDILIHQRADSRSKKNYNPAACGTKTTFTER